MSVQIDFPGISQRILSVTGIPERRYSELHAGVAGAVYYLEAGSGGRGARGGGGDGEGGGGSTLHRYRLTDRRATNFVTGVAEYSVSADGHKLLYRTGEGEGRGRGGPANGTSPNLFIGDADRNTPQAGQGRVNDRISGRCLSPRRVRRSRRRSRRCRQPERPTSRSCGSRCWKPRPAY